MLWSQWDTGVQIYLAKLQLACSLLVSGSMPQCSFHRPPMSSEFDGLFADIEASLDTGVASTSLANLASSAVADPLTMPEEFARSTTLALKAQQYILAMPLEEGDPLYRAKLMAKASCASAQITAQLKADETALKSRIATVSYYQEIKDALEAVKTQQLRDTG